MSSRSLIALLLAVLILVAVGAPAAQTPKRGGVLNAMLIENPPGFSIHESATPSQAKPLSSASRQSSPNPVSDSGSNTMPNRAVAVVMIGHTLAPTAA